MHAICMCFYSVFKYLVATANLRKMQIKCIISSLYQSFNFSWSSTHLFGPNKFCICLNEAGGLKKQTSHFKQAKKLWEVITLNIKCNA